MSESISADVANEKHSLYLRFPKKLNADRTLAESEVKSLCSKILKVRVPRQRSANFCLVDFASQEDKEKSLKKLKKVEINDKKLVVKDAVRNDKGRVNKIKEQIEVKREVNEALGKLIADIKRCSAKKYAQRNVTNGVMVKELKPGVTQSDIRRIFPEAIDIKLNVKADRKNSFALVWLPTPKDARTAASNTVQINGEEFVVSLENDAKQRKRKRANKSNDGDDHDESAEEEENGASEDSDLDGDESDESVDDDVEESD